MASPDFEIRAAEERLAELEYQIRKLLPGIQSTEMEWLVARFLQEKKLSLETMPEMLKRVWTSRYVRIPVSIREFICGKHYLNLPIGGTLQEHTNDIYYIVLRYIFAVPASVTKLPRERRSSLLGRNAPRRCVRATIFLKDVG